MLNVVDKDAAIENWKETAALYGKNADYYKELLDEIGENLGIAAYVSDDGSVQDSVLIEKLPELVKNVMYHVNKQDTHIDTITKENKELRENNLRLTAVVQNQILSEQEVTRKLLVTEEKLNNFNESHYVINSTETNKHLKAICRVLNKLNNKV